MSSVTTTTCHAPDCDETGPAYEFRDGDYCGTDCFYRGVGADILDDLRHDHRVCSTCWATLKEVNRPAEAQLRRAGATSLVRDAFVGFEHPTPNADRGEVNADDRRGPRAVVRTGTVCRCGQTDLRKSDEILQRAEGGRVVVNLLRQLIRLYDEGGIDHAPDKDCLFDALRERGQDWDYAVGYSLRGE